MSDKLQDMDVMEGWKSFLDKYNQALDRYVPKAGGNLKSKKPRRKQPLWMNEKALSKVKKKKAAFARYFRQGKEKITKNMLRQGTKQVPNAREQSSTMKNQWPTKQRVIQKRSMPTLTAR